jgi:hypothetical protein
MVLLIILFNFSLLLSIFKIIIVAYFFMVYSI